MGTCENKDLESIQACVHVKIRIKNLSKHVYMLK